jgi:hypothetical protein
VRRDLFAILCAGAAGALADAVYFTVDALLQESSVIAVLQSIASFWLGPASRQGGAASALLGLFTHFGLATIMAAAYFAAGPVLRPLRVRPIIAGAAYGVLLYAVMYFGVLPLRWPEYYPRINGIQSAFDLLAHVGVGLAIAVTLAKLTGAPDRHVGGP